MAEYWGSSFLQQQIDWQSSNLNCLGSLLNLNPATDMISVKGTPSIHQPLDSSHLYVGQAYEPHGRFCSLPQFQQFALNSGLQGKFPTAPCDNSKKSISTKLNSGFGQKKFLVFDQSGDQTTMIFDSGMRNHPLGYFTPLGTNTTDICNLNTQDPETKDNLNIHFGANETEQYAKDSKADLLSEMHEDTDELNALLYSDDDDSEDDEVTSTGHSPSTMTVHNERNFLEGGIEGEGSSNGSVKKRKLFEGDCNLPALMDTASSVKHISSFVYESDAESRCEKNTVSEHKNKKTRKDKIRETVNILQSIIPFGKGKDAVVVIDEAIEYLKSLKLKAKALGLDAP